MVKSESSIYSYFKICLNFILTNESVGYKKLLASMLKLDLH